MDFTGAFNLLAAGGLGDAQAQPVTAAGLATGPAITTGIVELGNGWYIFSGSVPDNTRHVTLSSALLGRRFTVSVRDNGANLTHVNGDPANGQAIDGTGNGARTVTVTVDD